MKKLAVGIAAIGLLACGKEVKTPDYVWPEERFVEVLTEFQVTEAIIRLGYHRKKDSTIHNDSLYNAMFRKLETSRAAFDSNYNYHLEDPESFTKIYEQVITNLSERAAELEQKKGPKKAKKKANKKKQVKKGNKKKAGNKTGTNHQAAKDSSNNKAK